MPAAVAGYLPQEMLSEYRIMKRSFRSASIGLAMTLALSMFTWLTTGCGTIDANGLLGLETCDILNCDGLFFRNLADDHDDMAGMDGMDDADAHDDGDDDHMDDMDGMDDADAHDDDGDDDHTDDMDEHSDDDVEDGEHDDAAEGDDESERSLLLDSPLGT